MSEKQSIIKVENLKRTFVVGSEEVHALKGVSFDIFQGEFVSIMGSSGSGKSTLLNILGCLDQPTAGEYLIDGISVRERTKNELSDIRNRKIGFEGLHYNNCQQLCCMGRNLSISLSRSLYQRFCLALDSSA